VASTKSRADEFRRTASSIRRIYVESLLGGLDATKAPRLERSGRMLKSGGKKAPKDKAEKMSDKPSAAAAASTGTKKKET